MSAPVSIAVLTPGCQRATSDGGEPAHRQANVPADGGSSAASWASSAVPGFMPAGAQLTGRYPRLASNCCSRAGVSPAPDAMLLSANQ